MTSGPSENMRHEKGRGSATPHAVAPVTCGARHSGPFARGMIVATLTFLLATPGLAQRVIEITGAAICRECRIAIEKAVRLRAPEGTPRFVFPSRVARSRIGRWFVVDPVGAPSVAVFDSTGRSLGRLSNPDRRDVTDVVAGPGDSISVYSADETVFDARGVRVRTRPLFERRTQVRRALHLRNGDLVVHAHVPTPGRFGYPFHLIAANGTVLRSFGAESNESSVASSFSALRNVARARPEGFWGARMNQYEVGLWSDDGELRAVVKRVVDWFPPWESWDSRFDITRPPPRLLSVWHDASDRLWVLTSVVASDWKPYGNSEGGEGTSNADVFNRSSDTMIDILDVKSGRLLVSQRFQQAFVAFVDEGYVLDITPGDANGAVAGLWRVRFIQEGGAP